MQIDNDAAITGGLILSNCLLYLASRFVSSYLQEEADRKARLERAQWLVQLDTGNRIDYDPTDLKGALERSYDVLGRYDPSALRRAERLLQQINAEKTSGRYLQ